VANCVRSGPLLFPLPSRRLVLRAPPPREPPLPLGPPGARPRRLGPMFFPVLGALRVTLSCDGARAKVPGGRPAPPVRGGGELTISRVILSGPRGVRTFAPGGGAAPEDSAPLVGSRKARPLGNAPPARPPPLGSGRRPWREVMLRTAWALRSLRGVGLVEGAIHKPISMYSILYRGRRIAYLKQLFRRRHPRACERRRGSCASSGCLSGLHICESNCVLRPSKDGHSEEACRQWMVDGAQCSREPRD
jgi:hypothetical protein